MLDILQNPSVYIAVGTIGCLLILMIGAIAIFSTDQGIEADWNAYFGRLNRGAELFLKQLAVTRDPAVLDADAIECFETRTGYLFAHDWANEFFDGVCWRWEGFVGVDSKIDSEFMAGVGGFVRERLKMNERGIRANRKRNEPIKLIGKSAPQHPEVTRR